MKTVQVASSMQRNKELKWGLAGTQQPFDPYPAVGPRCAFPPSWGGGKWPQEPAGASGPVVAHG